MGAFLILILRIPTGNREERTQMSDFKIIETQEDFDAAIASRLKRDREKYREQFETEMREKGWKTEEEVTALTADLSKQIETLQSAAASTEQILKDKDEQIAKGESYRADLEKTRIALSAGLSIEQVGRIQGSNADEWKKDAEKLVSEFQAYSASVNAPAPLGNAGTTASNDTRSQFANWAEQVLTP